MAWGLVRHMSFGHAHEAVLVCRMRLHLGYWLTFALCTLLCSCGDSPELIEESKQLDIEIAEVEQQFAEIRMQLGADVVDVNAEYEAAREQLAKQKAVASRLESELVDMRDEKESLELRFNQYRKSHPIN